MTLSCGDPEKGRRRPVARSAETGAIEESREPLEVNRSRNVRDGVCESTVLLSDRGGPAVRWVESVVIAMTGRNLSGVGCRGAARMISRNLLNLARNSPHSSTSAWRFSTVDCRQRRCWCHPGFEISDAIRCASRQINTSRNVLLDTHILGTYSLSFVV